MYMNVIDQCLVHVSGKNIGFAQFAQRASADRARTTLDGEVLGGIVTLKVPLIC